MAKLTTECVHWVTWHFQELVCSQDLVQLLRQNACILSHYIRNTYIRIHDVFHLGLERYPSIAITAEHSSLGQPLHVHFHFRWNISRHSHVYSGALYTLFWLLILSALHFLVAFLNVEKDYFLCGVGVYALKRRRHINVARRLWTCCPVQEATGW